MLLKRNVQLAHWHKDHYFYEKLFIILHASAHYTHIVINLDSLNTCSKGQITDLIFVTHTHAHSCYNKQKSDLSLHEVVTHSISI